MTTEAQPKAFAGKVIDVRTDKEVRCPQCNRLLLKGELAPGSRIEIKCTRPNCASILKFARL